MIPRNNDHWSWLHLPEGGGGGGGGGGGASEEQPLPSYRMAPIKAKRKKTKQTNGRTNLTHSINLLIPQN